MAEAILEARALSHLGSKGFKSEAARADYERNKEYRLGWCIQNRSRKGQRGYQAALANHRRWWKKVGVFPHRPWEPWEIQFLLDHAGLPSSALALALGRSIPAVILKRQSEERTAHEEERMKEEAKHFDAGKPPLDQLPFHALAQVALVMDFGARKYGRYNWRGGQEWTRYAASALRHLFAWISGEDKDPESGLSHLAHGVCNLLFLLEWQRTGAGTDDRYKDGQ